MKMVISLFLVAMCSAYGYGQTAKPSSNKKVLKRSVQAKPVPQPAATAAPAANAAPAQMRETATDRYLNGTNRKSTSSINPATATTPSGNSSPFAGGVHAADNAAKPFDSVSANQGNVNATQSTSSIVAGGKDTAFNVNTVNNGGITTNSGAVDRSGQTQFGQTNWGDGRGTVGESQWTIPPPISASFSKEFPSANSASWSRNKADTSLFSARYKSGTTWVTANYNGAGERLDMRTEVPMLQPPRPVSVFLAKQPATFHVVTINKLQMQGKAEVYEILTQTGKTIFLNNDGMEVDY